MVFAFSKKRAVLQRGASAQAGLREVTKPVSHAAESVPAASGKLGRGTFSKELQLEKIFQKRKCDKKSTCEFQC